MESIEIAGKPLSNDAPFMLFGGLNVLESEELTMEVAETFKEVCNRLTIPLVFKASFDKANRSSIESFRGLGLERGMAVMAKVKQATGLPLITDIHEPFQAKEVAEVCDVLQIPAFLARQTDLIRAASSTGRILNIKKPQFLAPQEMGHIINKCREAGNEKVIICERGSSFGYNNLVVDMLGFQVMKQWGNPIIFDVTHSLQKPGGLANAAGGRREFVTELARAGLAGKIAGLFLEAHPNPDKALCDGPCALRLDSLEPFLRQMKSVDDLVKSFDDLNTK